LQRQCQAGKIIGGQIFAAGLFGQAGHLFAFVGGQAKAHDMGGEINARRFKFCRQRARIALTGFDAIGDQHHRGLVFGRMQFGGGAAHGFGQRGFAQKLHLGRGIGNRLRGAGGWGHDGFNVVTGALIAMAIGNQAQFGFGRDAF
jgi:hypothetical protein